MPGEQESYTLNIAPVVPEAQSIVRDATTIYLRHLSQWCIGVIVHGSALKGGYIPGCSDIDLQVYLEPSAFHSSGDLPLELCLAIQRDLSNIDPTPFQYIQGYALPPYPRAGFVGPIPGAYHVVTGRLPVPAATEEQLQAGARHALETCDVASIFRVQALLQHGAWKLPQQVRWLCTDVWPTLYHVLTIQQGQGIKVWQLPKQEAMKLLPQEGHPAHLIQAFYHAVCRYYASNSSVDEALAAIEYGVAFIQSAKTWWEGNVLRTKLAHIVLKEGQGFNA